MHSRDDDSLLAGPSGLVSGPWLLVRIDLGDACHSF